MSLNIPTTPYEKAEEEHHISQKGEHERDIRENKIHQGDHPDHVHGEARSAAEKYHIGYEEKADRRQQDVDDAAIKETYNTEFREEDGVLGV